LTLSPEHVHDIAVRHRIGLSRHSTAVVRKIIALMNRTEDSVAERLARTSNETLAGQRLDTLLIELRAIQTDGSALIRARMTADVAALAVAEAEFAARLAGASPGSLADVFSPVPGEAQIVAAVNARPFQGRFLREWLSGLDERAAARVRDAVRQGFVEGRTTPDIIRSIRGTKALQYRDGIMEISRRGAEAMVRTAITHTANVAAQTTWDALGVAQWQFFATLDARTSLICMGLHGQVYPVGKGPMPPRHINCRSVGLPVVDPIPGVAPFDLPTYDGWLRRQSASVQDDVLGVAKGRLFRNGGLNVDKFTDNKGKTLTLDELRKRDASAFEAAGL